MLASLPEFFDVISRLAVEFLSVLILEDFDLPSLGMG